MSKDYYATLGVGKSATSEDIKKAYKRLAKQYHPDLNKATGSTEKFKEINEAYATLGDQNKRSNYDRFGTSEQFQGFSGGFEESGFEDIFENFFGGDIFGGRRSSRRGADLKYEMELDFEEAAFGVKKEVELSRLVNCEDCQGTGAENASMQTCSECNGKGTKRTGIRTPFGVISQTTTCHRCGGQGETAEKECRSCKGQGRKKETKTVTIKVPPGVNNGSTLKVRGEGDAGESGHGDLYVEMYVKPHSIFEREGNDILLTIPISFPQAALGADIDLPTLRGETTLKIPAGTQSYTIFRMQGKGIEDVHTGRKGDQLVKILVKTPTSLSKTQKELLAKLSEKQEKLKPEKDFFTKFKERFA